MCLRQCWSVFDKKGVCSQHKTSQQPLLCVIILHTDFTVNSKYKPNGLSLCVGDSFH